MTASPQQAQPLDVADALRIRLREIWKRQDAWAKVSERENEKGRFANPRALDVAESQSELLRTMEARCIEGLLQEAEADRAIQEALSGGPVELDLTGEAAGYRIGTAASSATPHTSSSVGPWSLLSAATTWTVEPSDGFNRALGRSLVEA